MWFSDSVLFQEKGITDKYLLEIFKIMAIVLGKSRALSPDTCTGRYLAFDKNSNIIIISPCTRESKIERLRKIFPRTPKYKIQRYLAQADENFEQCVQNLTKSRKKDDTAVKFLTIVKNLV